MQGFALTCIFGVVATFIAVNLVIENEPRIDSALVPTLVERVQGLVSGTVEDIINEKESGLGECLALPPNAVTGFGGQDGVASLLAGASGGACGRIVLACDACSLSSTNDMLFDVPWNVQLLRVRVETDDPSVNVL